MLILSAVLWVPGACEGAAPAHGESMSARPIYRCQRDGVTIFADRPCDPAGQTYQADASRISTYDAPPITSTPAQARPRRSTAASVAAPQSKQRAACDRLRSSMKELRSRMRAGYTAREGVRLQESYARLRERWRAQRCR